MGRLYVQENSNTMSITRSSFFAFARNRRGGRSFRRSPGPNLRRRLGQQVSDDDGGFVPLGFGIRKRGILEDRVRLVPNW